MKRNLDILVISDLHLGIYGSEADEVLAYLKTVEAKKIVINGDFVDIMLFNKKFWPNSHMKVVKHILDLISQGKEIHYVVGNHDELLRKFLNYKIKNFQIVNQVVLDTEEGKVWLFHGDVFDFSIQTAWITKLASFLYDYMIMFNSWLNKNVMKPMGRKRLNFSKTIKANVKTAIQYFSNFERVAAETAHKNGYKYVVCGHIHSPKIESFNVNGEEVIYMNSGDWLESLSSLEYVDNKWSIYMHTRSEDEFKKEEGARIEMTNKELYKDLIAEFKILQD
ncbi:MAG: UDP-2,3-diacylglucosamine diphosphatase [Cryomorphaceae bacterium]|nr:UDP-2,3-diacylglucosamine diphosphatase [Cryomorphaceae bacterium]MBT3503469.1 UDP-2,3-diacylglucosamine diphosphatase [Cryomorphaceae bacterium]MBT4517752.1 UDP-2,3-diacylglucosamine diphosphatase [Cryomorphaceae bacterium]MBT4834507.1 UDP-2,3-diacylglucosamine diphosphatase [Cryomorphaceae bacterium]MBT5936966.1 UDP-2,3-diacylglucosamine diphosphatase [Cryomorphaceae bacterium]